MMNAPAGSGTPDRHLPKDAYRAFYLGSLGHDPAEALEAIEFEQ